MKRFWKNDKLTRLGYYFAKLYSFLIRNHEALVEYYRKCGAKIGNQCLICTPIIGGDSWLVSIGDNTVISTDVELVLHDYSISRVIPEKSNLYGRINIGNNCFIGARSIIMYGVDISDNVIVAAGSVVVNSISDKNVIIGGNPARIIGTWEDLKNKHEMHATYAHSIREIVKKDESILIKRKCI